MSYGSSIAETLILLNAPLVVLISHPQVWGLFCESRDICAPNKCFLTCSSGGSPNSWRLPICSQSKTSWFAPSLLPSLSILAQKQTPRPPAGWRDGPRNSHGSAHPEARCTGSTKWTRQSSLRAASVILNHLPGKEGGWNSQQGPGGGMSAAVGENPPACRVVRAEWESPPGWKRLPRAHSS